MDSPFFLNLFLGDEKSGQTPKISLEHSFAKYLVDVHISAEHSIHQGNLREKTCDWELQSSNYSVQ